VGGLETASASTKREPSLLASKKVEAGSCHDDFKVIEVDEEGPTRNDSILQASFILMSKRRQAFVEQEGGRMRGRILTCSWVLQA
jgi:hypothetical protein